MDKIAEEVIDYALFHKAYGAEVFLENTTEKTTIYDTSQGEKVKCDFEQGIGIRLFFKNHYMYLSFNELNKNGILSKLKQLITNRDKNQNINIFHFFGNMFNPDLVMMEEPCILPILNEEVESYHKQLKFLRIRVKTIQEKKEIQILNSNNILKSKKLGHTKVYANLFNENKITSKGLVNIRGTKLDRLNINQSIEKAIKQSLLTDMKKETLVAENYPVIVGNGSGGILLHEICGHPLELRAVVHEKSFLRNTLNTKITSDKVTIIDDPLLEVGWGSNLIDDEGTDTTPTFLLENGIVKNFLCDQFNGSMSNFNTNGAARRESYRYPPTSRMSNTYLLPGEDKAEELINEVKMGVYIKELTEGGIDVVTGDFRVGIKEAYMIEKGKITKPIANRLVIGNANEALQHLEKIADDLSFSNHFCRAVSGRIPVSVGQPTVKYKSLNIR